MNQYQRLHSIPEYLKNVNFIFDLYLGHFYLTFKCKKQIARCRISELNDENVSEIFYKDYTLKVN